MEPEFHTIPLASTQHDIEADMNELMENTLKYQTFNKNEIKYLYHNLIDNCIYFLETSFESLYSNSTKPLNHQEYRIFIEKVLREARITIPLLYSIMYYIKRFRTAIRNTPQAILGIKDGLTINESEDLKKVFVSAAVLSLKFFNDRVIMNAEWTKFIDISVEQVNLCERQFIRLINYNLNLNVKNYYVFINDYLKKFNNNNNNNNNSSSTKPFPSGRTLPLPTITTSPPFERDMKCSSIIQPPLPQPQPQPQPQPLAMNNNIQSVYHTPTHHHQSYPQTMDISMNNGCNTNTNTNTNTNHTNSNTNTSSSNAYLSITPTPSVGSQVTPTPSGDRLLTPIDTTSYEMNYNNNNCNTMNYNNNNTNGFNNNFNYNNNNNTIDNNMNYNNGYNTNTNTNTNNTNINNNDYGYTNHCYQNQMNSSVLYCDPMSIGEQNSPQHQQYFTNTSYTSIMKTNSDSTFVSDLNHGSHHYAITSPQFYCSNSNSNSNMNNDNGHGIMNQENRMNVLPTPKNTYKTTMSCSSCSSECTLYQSNSMDEDGMMMQDQNNNNNRMPLNKLLYHNLHMKQNYSKDELRRISEVEEEML